MSTTEQQYPDFSGYTFEKVWAVIQESHLKWEQEHQRREQEHQKFEQKIEQEHQRQEQVYQRWDQEHQRQEQVYQRWDQEHQRREQVYQRWDQEHQEFMLEMQKLSEQQKETDRKMKETDRIIGRLGNRLGEFMESVIRPGVAKKFNELGYSFDGESRNLIIKDPLTKQRQTELDVILENGDSVVVVEVKLNPCIEDIKHFGQQLQYYRAYRNRNNPNDSKKIFGAMAATVFPDDVQQFALDSGYYAIVPSGESIQIVVPKQGELKTF